MSWVADIFSGVAKFLIDVLYVAAASLLLNVLFVPLLIVVA